MTLRNPIDDRCFLSSDVNFHETSKGMSSPAVDRRRSRMPPLPNNLTLPRPRPKSTHVINVALTSGLSSTPPSKQRDDSDIKKAATTKKNDSSIKDSPKSGSGHNTLSRIRLRKSKDKDRTPTPPKESFFSRSHKREGTPKESIGSPKLIEGPSQTQNLGNDSHRLSNNVTQSIESAKTEPNSEEVASKESTPIAKRKAREMYFDHDSFRGTPERDLGSSDTFSADFKSLPEVKSIDSHNFDRLSLSSAPMPYKHSRTASIGSNESSFSATLLGYGSLGGHRRMAHSFTEGNGEEYADTISEPADLGRTGSIRKASAVRATTPPPKPPPPKGLHKDVYNTVFALQELGTGWSDYLTRVRNLWDGHMSKPEAESKEVAASVDGQETAASASHGSAHSEAPAEDTCVQNAPETGAAAEQTSSHVPDGSGHSKGMIHSSSTFVVFIFPPLLSFHHFAESVLQVAKPPSVQIL